ncbi:MAG: SsrA-binding protein SmpB, partial [Clostridiales bacterium]|nr:SsrA-binding protein SmpB [Clostridiales bacterium]
MPKDKHGSKLIAQNKKAPHEYFIIETFQAGIELAGTEVKSLRAGKCNLKESYIRIDGGEAFIDGMHISPYEYGNIFNKDPLRRRRLLLHKSEINKLRGAASADGYAIVP